MSMPLLWTVMMGRFKLIPDCPCMRGHAALRQHHSVHMLFDVDFLSALKHRDSQRGTSGSACRVRTSLTIAHHGRSQGASCIVSMRV